jgi:hypothetical protein
VSWGSAVAEGWVPGRVNTGARTLAWSRNCRKPTKVSGVSDARCVLSDMGKGQFDHLCLTRWPFTVVPERELCTFLADRSQLQTEIGELLDGLSRRDTSSIHLFWAWLGAGKTHTLFYLANRTATFTRGKSGIIFHTVYTEFPERVRGFLDIYRSFVAALDQEILVESFLQVMTSPSSDHLRKMITQASTDLSTALRVLSVGQSQDQLTALQWLRAESISVSHYRTVGILKKIDTPEEAVRITTALVHLLDAAEKAKGNGGCRLLWLIDEFQRIRGAGSRLITEINDGLQSTFNACPRGLSFVLSFSGKPQEQLPPWLTPGLVDRIGGTKVMVLPPMLPSEALLFIKDVLAHARPSGSSQKSPFFPFSESACKAIISAIEKHGDIKPRAIMEACSAVLEAADLQIERDEIKTIGPDLVEQVLAERVVLSPGGEE